MEAANFRQEQLLEDFPNTNPYFPAPPRGSVVLLKVVAYLTLAAIIPCAIGTYILTRSHQDLMLAPVYVGVLLAVVFHVAFQELKPRSAWASGRIVPAYVELGASGPPPSISSSVRLLAHFLPFVPLVELLIRRIESRPDAACIAFLDRGRAVRVRVNTESDWERMKSGEFLWVHPGNPKRPLLLGWFAPPSYAHLPVPTAAREWLTNGLSEGANPDDGSDHKSTKT